MTLNLAQRAFKVIHFDCNRKPVCDFIRPLIVSFALSLYYFWRALYNLNSFVVNMPLSITVNEILPHIGRKSLSPLYSASPLGVKPSDLRSDPWYNAKPERISMIRSAVLIQYTRVTDRQTDRQTELPWYIRTVAYTCTCMLSRVKTPA